MTQADSNKDIRIHMDSKPGKKLKPMESGILIFPTPMDGFIRVLNKALRKKPKASFIKFIETGFFYFIHDIFLFEYHSYSAKNT
jgi:hypothetical protein